jgi:hypothetical protein
MKRKGLRVAFALLAVLSTTSQVLALPTVAKNTERTKSLLKTTAGCKPATAAIDLDINNVRARLMTGGDMWWNQGTNSAAYEVPKGSKKNSLFAGSCWIGGVDGTGQLKVAAQTYRTKGNDYWPGPIDRNTKSIDAVTCSDWDRFWKVDQSVVQEFIELYNNGGGATAITDSKFDVIKEWPATGNIYAVGATGNSLSTLLAPADAYGYAPFIDVNGDNIYNWKDGDYPRAFGVTGSNPSQFVWWVFNDMGNAKGNSGSAGIGIEVQTSAFAYSSTDFMNDATFYNYRVINRGNVVLDSCFIATWTDADLGYPYDDYIGCDTSRGLGVLYNAVNPDGSNGENSYGTRLPMIGVDFFIGPRKDYIDPVTGKNASRLLKMSTFSYFENSNSSPVRDPDNTSSFYNYMTGSTYAGIPFSFDGINSGSKGYGSGPTAPFVYYGDPGNKAEWSQCSCNSPLADRRFIHSSGPFTLQVGVMNDITIGVVWVDNVGACGAGSFKKIRAADDIAQGLFDAGFKKTVGPEAPQLVIRELDRKLIMYIVNPPNSNNYQERFGDLQFTSNDKYRSVSTKAKTLHFADSIYHFEGYRVFQIKKGASLFDANGNIDATNAVEIFQCDKKNGVSQIVNYSKNLEILDSIPKYDATIEITGKDSGIVHSFIVTQDAFATGEKTLVNYQTYYYKVIAYAYNNFSGFDPNNEVGTQDKAYLVGDNAAGGTTNDVYSAMPNPMNQRGDTFTNVSNYGQGVVITRIEGVGNGGNDVQLSDESEQTAIVSPYQVSYPTYKAGRGPVNIKVIDPVKLVNADWTISLSGNILPDTNRGLNDSATWTIVKLNPGGTNETIYSERSISMVNEQILEKYGLSVTVNQVNPVGFDQINGNGYITSDISYTNTALTWLSGVNDAAGISLKNWIRSGSSTDTATGAYYSCMGSGSFKDTKYDTSGAFFSKMFSNNTYTLSTWCPYDLASYTTGGACGYGPASGKIAKTVGLSMYISSDPPKDALSVYSEYPNVDLVYTSDQSKWTRCMVLEAQEDPSLSEGNVTKFAPRAHRSWNLGLDGNGNPVYSSDPTDNGFSWFPGYAVNQLTGERLNIVFAEDSYLKKFNGADMLWNPTSDMFNEFGETIFGGKHFTYILNTKYDSCKVFAVGAKDNFTSPYIYKPILKAMRWVGIPMLNSGFSMLSPKDGFIPTETRMRFRVNTPYKQYKAMPNQTIVNNRNPLYTFTTKGLAPTDWTQNTTADALLDKIFVVPNPYKGVATGGGSYESNRLETKVKIINLPVKASVNIYSLDGTLIRHLEKDNNDPALSWDLYNNAGLPIASGMYLIHVQAYGKDKVLKWFGAMRPLDVTNY